MDLVWYAYALQYDSIALFSVDPAKLTSDFAGPRIELPCLAQPLHSSSAAGCDFWRHLDIAIHFCRQTSTTIGSDRRTRRAATPSVGLEGRVVFRRSSEHAMAAQSPCQHHAPPVRILPLPAQNRSGNVPSGESKDHRVDAAGELLHSTFAVDVAPWYWSMGRCRARDTSVGDRGEKKRTEVSPVSLSFPLFHICKLTRRSDMPPTISSQRFSSYRRPSQETRTDSKQKQTASWRDCGWSSSSTSRRRESRNRRSILGNCCACFIRWTLRDRVACLAAFLQGQRAAERAGAGCASELPPEPTRDETPSLAPSPPSPPPPLVPSPSSLAASVRRFLRSARALDTSAYRRRSFTTILTAVPP